ncbi:MAG: hypothetical protein DGJ47_000284 [Rickettsiaceae bacterium]
MGVIRCFFNFIKSINCMSKEKFTDTSDVSPSVWKTMRSITRLQMSAHKKLEEKFNKEIGKIIPTTLVPSQKEYVDSIIDNIEMENISLVYNCLKKPNLNPENGLCSLSKSFYNPELLNRLEVIGNSDITVRDVKYYILHRTALNIFNKLPGIEESERALEINPSIAFKLLENGFDLKKLINQVDINPFHNKKFKSLSMHDEQGDFTTVPPIVLMDHHFANLSKAQKSKIEKIIENAQEGDNVVVTCDSGCFDIRQINCDDNLYLVPEKQLLSDWLVLTEKKDSILPDLSVSTDEKNNLSKIISAQTQEDFRYKINYNTEKLLEQIENNNLDKDQVDKFLKLLSEHPVVNFNNIDNVYKLTKALQPMIYSADAQFVNIVGLVILSNGSIVQYHQSKIKEIDEVLSRIDPKIANEYYNYAKELDSKQLLDTFDWESILQQTYDSVYKKIDDRVGINSKICLGFKYKPNNEQLDERINVTYHARERLINILKGIDNIFAKCLFAPDTVKFYRPLLQRIYFGFRDTEFVLQREKVNNIQTEYQQKAQECVEECLKSRYSDSETLNKFVKLNKDFRGSVVQTCSKMMNDPFQCQDPIICNELKKVVNKSLQQTDKIMAESTAKVLIGELSHIIKQENIGGILEHVVKEINYTNLAENNQKMQCIKRGLEARAEMNRCKLSFQFGNDENYAYQIEMTKYYDEYLQGFNQNLKSFFKVFVIDANSSLIQQILPYAKDDHWSELHFPYEDNEMLQNRKKLHEFIENWDDVLGDHLLLNEHERIDQKLTSAYKKFGKPLTLDPWDVSDNDIMDDLDSTPSDYLHNTLFIESPVGEIDFSPQE